MTVAEGQGISAGAVLRLSLGDGTAALAQVVAVEPRVVAVAVADVIWDCAPGVLDWQNSERALVHLALRPDGIAEAELVGHCPVEPASIEAHDRWRAAPQVTAAPLGAIVRALLSP